LREAETVGFGGSPTIWSFTIRMRLRPPQLLVVEEDICLEAAFLDMI